MNENMNRFFEGILMKHKAGKEISTGAVYAYRTWQFNLLNQSSEFECEDFPNDADMKDFVETLKASGAVTLAITDQSTALMRNLHTLESLGCRVSGLCKVTRNAFESREYREKNYNAIRVSLN